MRYILERWSVHIQAIFQNRLTLCWAHRIRVEEHATPVDVGPTSARLLELGCFSLSSACAAQN